MDLIRIILGYARDDLAWLDDALCAEVDPEMFFPEKGSSARPGKSVCRRCDVREDCLAYALRHDIRLGIWGGLTGSERDVLNGHRPSYRVADTRDDTEEAAA